ncbi:tyrosine-type recombinase/integrase [Desulfovirgula thermocuniculi]|uniref:tyrosine-type recombinase/integrase n=1 Tax=Desulfovirgula thermocuniculi TaxID=348842 RepID=UPI000481D0CC|nr:tyrosine-type recombinase/integrase [Desulfovirgula thermocuniculi]
MKPRLSLVVKSTSLADAVDAFLRYHAASNSRPSTIRWLRQTLSHFGKWLEAEGRSTDIREVTPEAIEEYLASMLRKGNKPATANNRLRALKCFFGFAHRRGMVRRDPAAGVRFVKATEPVVPTFSLKQLEKLLAAPDRDTFVGLRDYTAMHVMMDTGVRVGELLGLRRGDVEFDPASGLPAYLVVRNPKARRERTVPLPPETALALTEWLRALDEAMPGCEWLFPSLRGGRLAVRSLQQNIKRYGALAGIEGVRVSPHTFRHTLAKHYIMSGGDLASLKEVLGHSTLEMTARYGRLFGPDVRKKLSKLCPSAALKNLRKAGRTFGE